MNNNNNIECRNIVNRATFSIDGRVLVKTNYIVTPFFYKTKKENDCCNCKKNCKCK